MRKILVAFFVFSFISFASVWAYTAKQLESANYLASKGFITDKSETPDEYRLDDGITRKEFMKVIAKLSGEEVPDVCEWIFSDVVNDWGCKYIEFALKKGYIAQNALFRPDDNLTKTEAVKLVFKVRDIEKIYTTDNWQKDYADTARDLWLLEAYYDYNSDSSRGWIFEMIYNTYRQKVGETNVYTDDIQAK